MVGIGGGILNFSEFLAELCGSVNFILILKKHTHTFNV